MAKVTITYPTSGLTVSINVWNRDTNSLDFTGTCVENGTTGIYDYDFTEVANTDYIYVATTPGYIDVPGVLFRDTASGGGGGATVADIWGAQISDYSDTIGSFANKFSNYGGVSHVIERNNFDEESKKRLDELEKLIKSIKLPNDVGNIEEIRTLIKSIPESSNTEVLRIILNKIPKAEDIAKKLPKIEYDQSYTEGFITEAFPKILDEIESIKNIISSQDVISEIMKEYNKEMDRKDKLLQKKEDEIKKLKQLI